MNFFEPRLDALPLAQRRLWAELRPVTSQGFVLYGGTAIALRLGHRVSVDFDFFSERKLNHTGLLATVPFLATAQVLHEERSTLTVLASDPMAADVHVNLVSAKLSV